jgi:hypothetical protein
MQQHLLFKFAYSNNTKELRRNKVRVLDLKITDPIVLFTAHQQEHPIRLL